MAGTIDGRLLEVIGVAKAAGCPRDQVRNFLAGGYVPQARQCDFHALARAADEPDGPTQIGFGGARGPGKSHASICQVALDDCQRRPGLKWLFLRYIGSSAKESFEDLLTKALPFFQSYYVPSRSRIDLPNGSQVLFGGFRTENDINKYVGIEYDGIVVEELNLLSEDKYDRVRGSMRTSKTDWRPRVYATFNPGGIGHAWVKRRFVDPWRNGGEGDTRFVFSTVDDNAFVNPEYTAYLDGLTGWLRRAWRHGDWDIAAGQFFTNWRRETHVIAPIALSPGWRYWCALDYGFVHPTAVYLLCEFDGTTYVVDEHVEHHWLPEQHAQAIKALLTRNGLRLGDLETFVAGHDTFQERGTKEPKVSEQYAEHGIVLQMAQASRSARAATCLQALGDPGKGIVPKVKVFDLCHRLIECIPAMLHDPGRPEVVLKVDADEEGLDGDDPYDAWSYGMMEADRGRVIEVARGPIGAWRG
ncbi:MAG: phage terminase large subunit [Anaerolineae bacterium]|nr:phage terminase large subunit [Anaerolineae bacterium]